ncbi:MAG: DUF4340 domain-containing protein [Myxococcales bacterium]|nr:DUF4340 domain-containing protein [Myxococcales bacterium]
MNPRTTWILAFVAAALGAFIWLYEIRGEADRSAAQAAAKRIFVGVEPDDVDWVELRTRDGVDARLERDASARWRLVRPLDFPADEPTADGIASALAELDPIADIATPQAPEVYGLGDAAHVVRFGAKGAEHALRVGRDAPVGAARYAARDGDARVFTVASWRANAFDKDLAALRDARVLAFDRERVGALTARWPGGEVALAKRDGAWRVTAPLDAPADSDRVADLLSDLSYLRAEGFVDAPGEAERATLDPPAYAIELELAATDAGDAGDADDAPAARDVLQLAIGGEIDGARLVRTAGTTLFRVGADRLDDFPRRVVDYRDRTLARFAIGDAERLEIAFHDDGEGGDAASGPGTFAFEAHREAGAWTSTPPLREGMASALVASLSQLVAEDVDAEWIGDEERAALGLAPPRVELRVVGAVPEGGGEAPVLADVSLGRAAPSRGVAATAAGRDELFRLAPRAADDLPVSRAAFEERFVAPPEAPSGDAPPAPPAPADGAPGVAAPR